MHFPQEELVWSIGSGYGGNALLGKKCFSLRIASYLGLREGWLAEHMVIMGIEDLKGRVTYITAAMPSACGKTNLAMLQSALPDYKVWTIGDDIAWLNVGPDGRLYAINPEVGLLRRGAGDLDEDQPQHDPDAQGLELLPDPVHQRRPGHATPTSPGGKAWTARRRTCSTGRAGPGAPARRLKIAHPNSRFTVSLYQLPDPVPGIRQPPGRSDLGHPDRRPPLPPHAPGRARPSTGRTASSWGPGRARRRRPRRPGAVGVLRRDPFAMLPFCGYNMGDYFRHWMNIGALMRNPPKIFAVNWFRVDEDGKFVWPGLRRQHPRPEVGPATASTARSGPARRPSACCPRWPTSTWTAWPIPRAKIERLFDIKPAEWRQEVRLIKSFFEPFGRHIPYELRLQTEKLERAMA